MRRRGLAVVLKERAARVRGAHQHKDAPACGCTDLDEGVERVRTHPGVHRDRVCSEGSVRRKNGACVGRGGRGDVPPLRVRDDDQPAVAGSIAGLFEGRKARRTQRLVESVLRLDGTNSPRDRIDDEVVELQHRLRRLDPKIQTAPVCVPLTKCRRELIQVGVKPDYCAVTDLAYRGRHPFTKHESLALADLLSVLFQSRRNFAGGGVVIIVCDAGDLKHCAEEPVIDRSPEALRNHGLNDGSRTEDQLAGRHAQGATRHGL